MKKISILLIAFSLISFTLTSCSDDDDDTDDNSNNSIFTGSNCYNAWINAYSQSTQQIASAAQAYSFNPTVENCNAYKAAYQNFLNDLKPFQNCAAIPAIERQGFIQEIEDAEAEIDDLC